MNEDKLKEVAHSAIVSFWNEVALNFPEIETGDLSVGSVIAFDDFAEEMVREWVETNGKRG
jgi:hypothetical protein